MKLKILSKPNGNAEEYGRWAVNPYKGCSNGCAYCYLKKGPWKNGLGGDTPVLKEHVLSPVHAYDLAMQEIGRHREQIIRDGGLFITFTSDPCIRETRWLSFRIAAGAVDLGVPVTLLTKNADFFRWGTLDQMIGQKKRLQELREEERIKVISDGMVFPTWFGGQRTDTAKKLVAFGWTLTGHDELEPGASPNAERLEAMRRMSAERYNTWASIDPVIDFESSYRMVADAVAAGCRHFRIGLLTNRTRVVRKPFELAGSQYAYDRDECLHFIDFVMAVTQGMATVYWKQSVVDFLQVSAKNPEPVRGMTAQEYLFQWPHSVGKTWLPTDMARTDLLK